MKVNSTVYSVILTGAIVFFIISISHLHSQADTINYPAPSYDGKELQDLRQWEKIWSGKRIEPDTIAEVKEFVPETLYQIISDPATWGDIWFEIVPYRQIKPSHGDLLFTEKYAGSCKISNDDKLLNYVCGIPFPNPETALEIAYNFDHVNKGDHIQSLQDLYIIDGKKRYDRKMAFFSHMLFLSARREIPPVPDITPNPKNIFRASHGAYLEPASMKGSRSVSFKFIDRSIDYEQWSFSSTTRKVTRISTSQRTTTQGGTDSTTDDQNIYAGAIEFMNYKYLGRKELLLARHQNPDMLKNGHIEGYCVLNGFQRERINTYVLECTHKNPNYLYSKQIWYVDPETWWILYSDKYDRKGNLWRVIENANRVYESAYNGAQISNVEFVSFLDAKSVHSSAGFANYSIGETGRFYNLDYYTPQALHKYGY